MCLFVYSSLFVTLKAYYPKFSRIMSLRVLIIACSIMQVCLFSVVLMSCLCILQYADTLVLDFQFVHDGYIPYWFSVNDIDANSQE